MQTGADQQLVTTIENQLQHEQYLSQHVTQAVLDSRNARPKATKSAYVPKQQEFIRWCDARFHSIARPTRYFVSESSVIAFLREKVIGRRRKYKGAVGEVGEPTIQQYINALTDMYKVQRSEGMHNYPEPRRGAALRGLVDTVKREKTSRSKRNYDDRGKISCRQNCLTDEEKQRIADFCWHKNNWKGIRDLMSLTNMRAMVLRGENMRILELPDLFLYPMVREGNGCVAIVSVLNQGKKNQYGKQEMAGTLRSKSISWCAHGALARWLYYRFDICDPGFPIMNRSEDWYDLKLFPSKLSTWDSQKGEMSDKSHYKRTQRVLERCGISSDKVTHLWRGNSAREQQALGVPHSDRNRSGRWQAGMNSMDNSYSMDLPETSLRALAGFSPDYRNFFIARDLDVPVGLLHMIFPLVDQLLFDEMNNHAKNLAKVQFLKLLQYLRKVLVQDACFLTTRYPNHPIWKTPVFRSRAFLDFRVKMMEHVDTVEDPCVPRLVEALPPAFDKISGEIIQVKNEIKMTCQNLLSKIEALEAKIGKRQRISLDIGTDEINITQADPPADPPAGGDQIYEMCRDVQTIPRLWEEWTVGLHGQPSIRQLEENKVKWKTTTKEKMFFARRKAVIGIVIELSTVKKVSRDDAVQLLEEYRALTKKTIDWISKNVNLVRQALNLNAS